MPPSPPPPPHQNARPTLRNTATVALTDVTAKFHEAALCPDLWPEALDLAASAFSARGAILPSASFDSRMILHSRRMGPVLDQFFTQGWHLRDARTIAALRCDLSRDIVTDQSLFHPDTIARSPYYDGFARAAGVPWFCAVSLAHDAPGDYLALSLQRSASEGPFEAADLARLRQILPQLRNAAALARSLQRQHAAGVLQGLNLAGMAAAVVSRAGRLRAANARFDALRHSGLQVTAGRLRAGHPPDQPALTALIACPEAGTGPLILRATSALPPLVLRAAPLPGAASAAIGHDGVLLTLIDLAAEVEQSEALLRQSFDLTPREAQVMALLGRGHDIPTIAALLSISRETVRFHVKTIFGKTGTHRQSEVLALCLRLGRI